MNIFKILKWDHGTVWTYLTKRGGGGEAGDATNLSTGLNNFTPQIVLVANLLSSNSEKD